MNYDIETQAKKRITYESLATGDLFVFVGGRSVFMKTDRNPESAVRLADGELVFLPPDQILQLVEQVRPAKFQVLVEEHLADGD